MKRALLSISAAERSTVPLLRKKRSEQEKELPIIVNFVATTPLLPQNTDVTYTLPLTTISAKWGCSQYAPNLFAANIIRIQDSTVLLFVSGIMVVVSGQSINHARDVSQTVRLNLENMTCMMKRENDAGGVEVYEGTLKGRMTFQEGSIHNIVGHGNVGMRINLQALVDAAPDCWKWFPDLFPGAKGKIWLTESNQCECRLDESEFEPLKKIMGKRSKCKCSVKVLVFDTGQVVITGGRTIQDLNAIFKRIRNLAPRFESSNQTEIPKEERFYKRLSTMMVPAGVDSANTNKPTTRDTMEPEDVVACILSNIQIGGNESVPVDDGGVTPLMRMAEAGRVEDVEMLLMIDPEQKEKRDAQGRTALERLVELSEKSDAIYSLIKMLE